MALSQSGHETRPEYRVDFYMFDCPKDSEKITVWDSDVDVANKEKLNAYLRSAIAHRRTGNYSDAAFVQITSCRKLPEMN